MPRNRDEPKKKVIPMALREGAKQAAWTLKLRPPSHLRVEGENGGCHSCAMRHLLIFPCLIGLLMPHFPSLTAAADASAQSVVDQLETLQNSELGRPASVGFILLDAETGDGLVDYYAARLAIPASTMKVIATGTILHQLGPDYAFRTQLQVAGEIEEGELQGDVILQGGGDPTLGDDGTDAVFDRWTSALKAAGIQSVSGRIIGDESRFDTQLVAGESLWMDLGNYYGAGSSALSILENEYRLTFRTGSPGSPATLLGASPEPPGLTFITEMKAGPHGSGDEGYLYSGPYDDTAYARGTLPPGRGRFSIRGAFPDPARFVATAFREHLSEAGIEVKGEATTSRLLAAAGADLPKSRTTLNTLESAPLSQLLIDTNRWSRNLNADAAMKTVGAEAYKQGGFKTGRRAIVEHWEEAGVDLESANLVDGSGLSRSNLISPRQMAEVLQVLGQSEVGESFRATLPVAGRSGTIRNFGKNTVFEGKFRAKTGTMNRIKAVAGYLQTASGDEVVLVFFVNHYEGSHSQAVAAMEKVIATAYEKF